MSDIQSTKEDLYPFSTIEEQRLFVKITHELRCSVCQNESLSDSMAPLAIDLRNEIYHQIRSKQSEQQIVEFITQRYGSFVLYRPPLKWDTAVLWFGPLFILIICLLLFFKKFYSSCKGVANIQV